MVGVDPEMFLVDKNGRSVPAHKLFPEKSKRECISFNKSSYYRDGYAVEFNIDSGQTCRETLITYLYEAIFEAAYRASKHKLHLVSVPAVRVALNELEDAPPDVQIFGCNPSANAYTKISSVPDINAMTHPFRYAGGHLHFSFPYRSRTQNLMWPKDHNWILKPENVFLFVKMMDLFVGIPMTYIEANPLNFLRRQNYGKAGEFRFQIYPSSDGQLGGVGIEYRTLSPFWLRQPALLSFALGMGREIFNNFFAYAKNWDSKIEPDVQKAINTGIGLRKLLQDIPAIHDSDNACDDARVVPKAFLTKLASLRIKERNYLDEVEGHRVGWYRWLSTWKGVV